MIDIGPYTLAATTTCVYVQSVKCRHQYFRFFWKSCQYRDFRPGTNLKWKLWEFYILYVSSVSRHRGDTGCAAYTKVSPKRYGTAYTKASPWNRLISIPIALPNIGIYDMKISTKVHKWGGLGATKNDVLVYTLHFSRQKWGRICYFIG